PYATLKTATIVRYVPLIVRWHAGPYTFDPTQPTCGDNVAISTRFYGSPIFNPIKINSNGIPVAGDGQQLISAYQRANFWSSVANTKYAVTLSPSRSAIVVDR